MKLHLNHVQTTAATFFGTLLACFSMVFFGLYSEEIQNLFNKIAYEIGKWVWL